MVPFRTLKEQDTAPELWRRKSTKFTYSYRSSCRTRLGSKIASRRLLKQWLPRRRRLQILNKLLGILWLASLLWNRNAASGSSSPDLARPWNMLGQINGSTATGSLGSHGPGSSDDSRNTRRRLDTFSSPEGEQARSVVLLRFPCEQYHTGITNWINNLWENQTFQLLIKPSEFIAKQVPCQPDSYLKHEPSVRTLCPDIKMMVSPMKLAVPSAVPKHLSRSANPNHLKTGLCVPGVPGEVLQKVITQASTANVWWPPFCLPAFSAPGGSRRPFPRFPVSMGSTLCAIFDSQRNRA